MNPPGPRPSVPAKSALTAPSTLGWSLLVAWIVLKLILVLILAPGGAGRFLYAGF